MAVTLTSTGITFSDGTNQSSAASGGVDGSKQVFHNSGTWSRPAGVGSIMVSLGGGGGGGGGCGDFNGCAPGGPGGYLPPTWASVSANQSVTVGGGGAGGNHGHIGNAGSTGGASSAVGFSANGGGGGTRGYQGNRTPGNPGNNSVNSRGPKAAGTLGGPSGNSGTPGQPGWAVIYW